MSKVNFFEIASREGYRFETGCGSISTEDLWNLPLKHGTRINLNHIAIGLNTRIKEANQDNFVDEKDPNTDVLENKLEIVKYIIQYKLDKIKKEKEAKYKAERKQKLLDALAKKQDASIESMSEEDILKEINSL